MVCLRSPTFKNLHTSSRCIRVVTTIDVVFNLRGHLAINNNRTELNAIVGAVQAPMPMYCIVQKSKTGFVVT